MPSAPHELVPQVPQALSRLALRLLAKTLAARLPDAEALLRALWEAKKEAQGHAWRVPLPLPPEGMGRGRRGLQWTFTPRRVRWLVAALGLLLASVIARYTRAKLPDGREVPVCIVLGGPDGRVPKVEGSTAEAVLLPRELPANAVWRWP